MLTGLFQHIEKTRQMNYVETTCTNDQWNDKTNIKDINKQRKIIIEKKNSHKYTRGMMK